MKLKSSFWVMAIALTLVGTAHAQAQTNGTPVFNNLPAVTPPNTWSQCFECSGVSEMGDEIKLEAGTPRRAGFVTVLMSNWALRADYPNLASGGYTQSITLNIYADAAAAAAHTPAATRTQVFTIPWRPVVDPSCGGDGTGWKSTDGGCYHGFTFPIVFDLRTLNYSFPDKFVYGIATNTRSAGYTPTRLDSPADSLNVALAIASNPNPDLEVPYSPSVGSDINKDIVFINYFNSAFYTPPAPGFGALRPDTGWAPYSTFAVKFSTFTTAKDADDCKNGAWQNLARKDFSLFANQTACVAYTKGDDKGDDKKDEKKDIKKDDKKDSDKRHHKG